jgi:hypothetical protein
MIGPFTRRALYVCPLVFIVASAATAQQVSAQQVSAQQVSAQKASAQQPAKPDNTGRRSISALRLAEGERLTLDGRLDEAFWTRATPANNFIQIDPANGSPATEPTEVRIAFDGDSLYIGVTCFDSEPTRWLGYETRRDQFLGSDDRFMWTIDTFLDTRSGYFFEMNPSGLMADSVFGINGDNRAWDGIWNARVRRSEIGWTIEIEIPFRTVNFDPNNDTWGMNFQRTVRRKNEDSIWMGWVRNQGLRRMTNAGLVTGINNVTQGHGLDIKPYGLATFDSTPQRQDGRVQREANAGVDLLYNPTPGLRANLTINTDFAQTEVDQRQVDLSRFSLFFPEKRDFFLDGATFFDFGSPTGDLQVNPFFSRRIGLDANGEPQTINFGTKITGQMGGQDVGILHVQTGADSDQGIVGEDFTIARVKRRLLRQSYVGAMYTRRDARGDATGASHTLGVDAKFGTSSFLGNQNLEASGWLLHAMRPGASGGTNAFGAAINYPNDRWNASADLREVQQQFDPAVGFVTRRSYRRYQPSLNVGPRPRANRYVRRFVSGASLDIQTDLDNRLLQRTLGATLLETQFQSQDTVAAGFSRTEERLDEPFTISRGITLPLGAEYNYARLWVRGQTANRRVLALNLRYEAGDYYSGSRTQRSAGLNVRIRPGYIVYMNAEWNDIDLVEGRFSSNLFRLIGETQFTPFIALVNNVQFDTSSRVMGWQSRFRWIMKPGNDLYVVYTHNWQEDLFLGRFSTLSRKAASKLLYTHRL